MRRHRLTLIVSVVAAACRVFDYGETADVVAVVSLTLITLTLISSRMPWETGANHAHRRSGERAMTQC